MVPSTICPSICSAIWTKMGRPSSPAPSPPHVGPTVRAMSDAPLVWIDCEMTGLDLATDALIEVACIVTDAELNPLGEGVSVIIKPPSDAVEVMTDFVRQMHVKSGLLPELDGGLTICL